MNATSFLLLVMMIHTSLQFQTSRGKVEREKVDGEITEHIETLTSSDNRTPDELKVVVDGQLNTFTIINFINSRTGHENYAKLMAKLDGMFCVEKILLYGEDTSYNVVCNAMTRTCYGDREVIEKKLILSRGGARRRS